MIAWPTCGQDRALSATACDDVGFMRECPAACGLCSNLCVDHARECSIWAKEGRCDAANHLASMLQTCPSSCGLCNRLEQEYNDTPCVDEDECANWALAGMRSVWSSMPSFAIQLEPFDFSVELRVTTA